MQYEIKGTPFPVVICKLDNGEAMITERGSMTWMTPGLDMKTVGGGVGKAIGRMFAGEAGVVSRRGIRLTTMANTGGRTWDCGVTPFVPVPDRWLDRHRALRDAHRRWNLAGLMESHHYGFQPNFIAEIAKASFTEESDDASVRETLRGIAARDFGCANVEAVLDAWHDWSEAFRFHSARYFDQGGPLRIGPTFALVLPGDPWPLPPHPPNLPLKACQQAQAWLSRKAL